MSRDRVVHDRTVYEISSDNLYKWAEGKSEEVIRAFIELLMMDGNSVTHWEKLEPGEAASGISSKITKEPDLL